MVSWFFCFCAYAKVIHNGGKCANAHYLAYDSRKVKQKEEEETVFPWHGSN